jgi:hypothetical protein
MRRYLKAGVLAAAIAAGPGRTEAECFDADGCFAALRAVLQARLPGDGPAQATVLERSLRVLEPPSAGLARDLRRFRIADRLLEGAFPGDSGIGTSLEDLLRELESEVWTSRADFRTVVDWYSGTPEEEAAATFALARAEGLLRQAWIAASRYRAATLHERALATIRSARRVFTGGAAEYTGEVSALVDGRESRWIGGSRPGVVVVQAFHPGGTRFGLRAAYPYSPYADNPVYGTGLAILLDADGPGTYSLAPGSGFLDTVYFFDPAHGTIREGAVTLEQHPWDDTVSGTFWFLTTDSRGRSIRVTDGRFSLRRAR